MVPKSELREAIDEVLSEHGVEDGDVGDALIDRLETFGVVYDDEDKKTEEEEA